eukprot:6180973-Pleurochrysis_carterae.AAC.4
MSLTSLSLRPHSPTRRALEQTGASADARRAGWGAAPSRPMLQPVRAIERTWRGWRWRGDVGAVVRYRQLAGDLQSARCGRISRIVARTFTCFEIFTSSQASAQRSCRPPTICKINQNHALHHAKVRQP